MKRVSRRGLEKGVRKAFGVAVKPESDDDWMIRGESVDKKFVPDFVPVDIFDKFGRPKRSMAKVLTPESMERYAEKHFESFKAAAAYCRQNGWTAIEGY